MIANAIIKARDQNFKLEKSFSVIKLFFSQNAIIEAIDERIYRIYYLHQSPFQREISFLKMIHVIKQ